MDLPCMICGKQARDGKHPFEFDGHDYWVYCLNCDVWTSHPCRHEFLTTNAGHRVCEICGNEEQPPT